MAGAVRNRGCLLSLRILRIEVFESRRVDSAAAHLGWARRLTRGTATPAPWNWREGDESVR